MTEIGEVPQEIAEAAENVQMTPTKASDNYINRADSHGFNIYGKAGNLMIAGAAAFGALDLLGKSDVSNRQIEALLVSGAVFKTLDLLSKSRPGQFIGKQILRTGNDNPKS